MSSLYAVIRLLRPAQWAKNLFVFLPMFFGGRLFDPESWAESAIAFVAFSLMASAVYCLNDIVDVEADRRHPRKCRRPVASGDVPVGVASAVMVILAAGSIAISLWLLHAGARVALILGVYCLLNVCYCLRLKEYAIIDVFIVSVGFVLRLMCGGVACGIWLSPWIVLMTFLLALFLAFAKRRDDVVLHEETGLVARRNIVKYNSAFLDQTLGIIAAVTMVCYITYTVSPEVEARLGSGYLYVTSVFVLAGILRYLQVAIVDKRSGSPTGILLRDRFVQLCIAGWLLTFGLILYL